MSAPVLRPTPRVKEGVYINYPARAYFEQPAMGSSDFMTIDRQKEGWWMTSRHNPDRVIPKSVYLTYGSALHAILLEGLDAYEAGYAVAPDKRSYPDLVETIDEMKTVLSEAGVSLSGTSKFSKGDWCALMARYLPDHPCWGNLYEEFVIRAGNRERISAVEDRMLRHMVDVATNPERSDNVDVRKLFDHNDPDHPPLAEISVSAEQDGIWRRWRFDRMLPGATMDLKSLGAWQGRPLPYETGEVSARRRWEIQRADYHDGRLEAYRLIREGKVFGGTLAQHRYLEQIAAENQKFGFVWMVYQKPDPAGRAAVLMPVWDEQDSEVHEWGRLKLGAAKKFYREHVAEFGLEKPWARVERMHFSDPTMKPSIPYPDWMMRAEIPTTAAAYEASAETELEADDA